MSKDPIGFAAGDVNVYAYCSGDPVGLLDPSGLKVWVYMTPVFGIPGAPNHAWVGSDETYQGRGLSGSEAFGSSWGGETNGTDWASVNAGNFNALPVDQQGLTDSQFLGMIDDYPGWNKGYYGWLPKPFTPNPWPQNTRTLPIVGVGNDCHDQLKRAFDYAGFEYPSSAVDRLYWGYGQYSPCGLQDCACGSGAD